MKEPHRRQPVRLQNKGLSDYIREREIMKYIVVIEHGYMTTEYAFSSVIEAAQFAHMALENRVVSHNAEGSEREYSIIIKFREES